MRERVNMRLGGREVSLLPAFEVWDQFEDRFGPVISFLQKLVEGEATGDERAYMIWLGCKAGDPVTDWDLGTVKERIFEHGIFDEERLRKEIEFVERLIYTPEQYLKKNQDREEAAKAMSEAMENWKGSPDPGTAEDQS